MRGGYPPQKGKYMKKLLCILLAIVFIFALTACKEESKKETVIEESTQEISTTVYPSPRTVTWEKSENNLGARYTFTLEEFNTMLNERCENLGNSDVSEFFDFKNWEIMADNLVDNNGIEYTSYCYSTDVLTITAAVENKSEKVMNLGCGTSYNDFVSSDAEYQHTVMLTSAIIAMTAGDYSDENLEFLYCIFFDSAKNDKQFFYNNSVYMLNMSKEEGEEGAALLFMMSPCKDEILEEWELTDYSTFDGSFEK